MIIKDHWMIDSEKTLFGDIEVVDGIISRVIEKEHGGAPMKKVIFPAFIDMHVHFRTPGFHHKEDMESGSRAAVKGGYTYVTLMANTNPPCDSDEIFKDIMDRGRDLGLLNMTQCISGTRGLKGEECGHLEELKDSRIKCISDDGKGVMNEEIMRKVIMQCKNKNWLFLSHAEDESKDTMRDRENSMTDRDVKLANEMNSPLHMCHVSTKESIGIIREGKKSNGRLTCEVTPHHIVIPRGIEEYRVNPPIREIEDVRSIHEGIMDGTVDVIATDHAPHTKEDKDNGSPGISGIEYAFSICNTTLVEEGLITLNKLSELMSGRAAEILGLNRGKIEEGFAGDLTIVDLSQDTAVCEEDMESKGKNTPFLGRRFKGRVTKTICGGKVVYDMEENNDNR